MADDRWPCTSRWRVRQYDLDDNGHVSNAIGCRIVQRPEGRDIS